MPFEGLIRSCMDEKRISELEVLTGETSKTENQREKDWTKQQNISGLWDSYKRCTIHIMGIPEEEEEKKNRTIRNNSDWEFAQINTRYHHRSRRVREHKAGQMPKNTYAHHCEITERQRQRKHPETIQREKHLTYGGTNRRITFNFS